MVLSSGFGDSCWFCLKSPQVEKHLVVSVGNEVQPLLLSRRVNKLTTTAILLFDDVLH